MQLLEIRKHVPEGRYSTEELLDSLPTLSDRLRSTISKRLGVSYRHSVLPGIPALLSDRIEPQKSCSDLAAEVACKCLDTYCVKPSDVDLLIAATDTCDYICPSLAPLLIPKVGLSPYITSYSLDGMGCSGLIKAMDLAETHLVRFPNHLVLVVIAEVQSAYVDAVGTFKEKVFSFSEIKQQEVNEETRQRMFRQTLSIIQLFLFGDGAVAMLLGNRKGRLRFVCSSHVTNLDPEDATLVYFPEGGSLQPNVVSNQRPIFVMKTDKVASRGSEYGAEALDKLLKNPDWPSQDLADLSEVEEWLLHPGSKVVLDIVSSTVKKVLASSKSRWLKMMPTLRSSSAGLSASYKVLSDYGNLSGAALGFILEEVINSKERQPRPKSYGILLGFGAGFSSSAALVQFLE